MSIDFSFLRREQLFSIESRSQGTLIATGGLSAVAFFTLPLAVDAGAVSIVTAIVNLDAGIVFVGAVALTRIFPRVIDEQTDIVTLLQNGAATGRIIAGGALMERFASVGRAATRYRLR